MSLRINNNIASVNGHRNLMRNDSMISKSLERLSSGLRINRAADDAAGLIISEQMRAQLTGIEQAVANSETAVSMIQTAEGALDEVNTLLNKARSLAIHAANDGANDQSQLVADQQELDNIIQSVTRIAENTQFGNKKLLDGSNSSAVSNNANIASVTLGSDYNTKLANDTIAKGFHTVEVTTQASKQVLEITGGTSDIITGVDLSTMSGTEEFQKSFTIKVAGADVSVVSGTTKEQFVQLLNSVGKSNGFTAIASTGTTVSNGTASGTVAVAAGAITLVADDFGSDNNLTFEFVSGATGAQALAGSSTAGVDAQATIYFASGEGLTATTGSTNTFTINSGVGLSLSTSGFSLELSANMRSGTILEGAIDGTKGGATFHIGANEGQTVTVQVGSTRSEDLGKGASSVFKSLAELEGGSLIQGNANEALKVIDEAIDDITTLRGELGAVQSNTLETNINSLNIATENLTAAESAIRDVDFAAESAEFTKNNILLQASTAMLAQANQMPQNVLQLLG